MTKTEMREHLRHSRYIVAPSMVEGDEVEAYAINDAIDAAEGRCEACGERMMFDDPHANLCPLDPDTLEEAGERVRAITSADELDARGAELRRCNGGPSAFPACGKPVEANGYCVDHGGCARCATTHPHAADRHNYGAGCVHAPSR